MFLYKTQSSAKRRTDDLIFSGRTLIKMRNRTGPKTDPEILITLGGGGGGGGDQY